MAEQIAAERFDVTLFPASIGQVSESPPAHAHWARVCWEQDAEETRTVLDAIQPDWLVMDHYAFDARWQTAARPKNTRLTVVDDLADRLHDCELLLDQNLGHEAHYYDGLVPDRCVRLIGPRYALLRPEFAAARSKALADREGRGLRNLLITMGGVDQADATSTVLSVLRNAILPEGLHITVIMGANAPALDRVRVLAEEMPRSTMVAVGVADMAAHMAHADLAISAAGGTTWERCCLGLPGIIVETAENQAGIAQAMAEAGAAFDPGPLTAADFVLALQTALSEASDVALLDALSENAAAICDGDGVARVVAALEIGCLHED
ncbi:UDP-2,4-diacetamido-2,4,6-trideoxy-beta-L-altropyranose hydrolase, partial [Roseibium sp.]